MGLDMYLIKSTYIGAEYDHRKISGTVSIFKDGKEIPIQLKRINCIREKVGYWRKANAIHKWFVDNVQDGKDEGQEVEVSQKQLNDLLALCKQVKEMPELAIKLLPTMSGFFFGSADYEEGYMQNIDSTIEIIESLLAEGSPEKDYLPFEVYYRSSW